MRHANLSRPRQWAGASLLLFATLAAVPAQAGELKRTENADGSSAYNVNWSLPTGWESKVGVDMTMAAAVPTRTAGDAEGNSAAWANVTVPNTWLPLWDKASVDARLDSGSHETTLGTTFSRSLPIGDRLSVKIENRYALIHSDAAAAASAETLSSGGTVSLNVLATDTTLSAGTTLSTGEEQWSATVSAGQKLFGLIEVNAAMSESGSGAQDRRLGASFRRRF